MSSECMRLQLERYAGGELNETERREVRRHLDSCSDCSSFIAQLEAERTEFLQRHPFSSFTRAHAPAVALPWYRSFFTAVLRPSFVPVYGVVLLLLVIVPMHFTDKDPVTRFKGKNAISFIYKRDGIIREGVSSLRFRAGDQIQVTYSLSLPRYVSLLSIDSRGTVSFYHPDRRAGTCSIYSDAGSSLTFPGSIILDDSPGAELVIALFSDEALPSAAVTAWVKGLFIRYDDPGKLCDRLQRESAGIGGIPAETAALLLQKE